MTYLLKFSEVEKHYYKQERPALKNFSFLLPPKRIVALIGPNGAGKTTTCKIMSTVLYPDRGKIEFKGKDIFKNRLWYLRQIGVVFGHKTKLMENISFIDNLKFFTSLYGLDYNESINWGLRLVEELNISHLLSRRPREFSLGERTKSEVVVSLLHKPELMILDEPTIGVDLISRTTLYEIIKEYVNKKQSSVFITSHNAEDIRKLATDIILINMGEKIFQGSMNEFIDKFESDNRIVKLKFSNIDEFKKAILTFKKYRINVHNENNTIIIKTRKDTVKNILQQLNIFEDFSISIEKEPLEDIIRRSFKS